MVIIPFQNKKDLEDIPAEILKKVKIVPVQEVSEVLKLALEKYPPPSPKAKATKAKPAKAAVAAPKTVVRKGART
jgi:ATP-dependent Lon protease